MNNELNNQIIYEADYYLNNNEDLTISELANRLSEVLNKNISESALHKHFQKLQQLDPEKYEKLRKKIEEVSRRKNVLGGAKGKRTSKYDPELIKKIAFDIIQSVIDETNQVGMAITLGEASDKYHIPKQTLSGLFKMVLSESEYEMLENAFLYNKTKGKKSLRNR